MIWARYALPVRLSSKGFASTESICRTHTLRSSPWTLNCFFDIFFMLLPFHFYCHSFCEAINSELFSSWNVCFQDNQYGLGQYIQFFADIFSVAQDGQGGADPWEAGVRSASRKDSGPAGSLSSFLPTFFTYSWLRHCGYL